MYCSALSEAAPVVKSKTPVDINSVSSTLPFSVAPDITRLKLLSSPAARFILLVDNTALYTHDTVILFDVIV